MTKDDSVASSEGDGHSDLDQVTVVCLAPDDPNVVTQSRAIAEQLSLSWTETPLTQGVQLEVTTESVGLRDISSGQRAMVCDFTSGRFEQRQKSAVRQELLIKAIEGRRRTGQVGVQRVVDATAGLGRDTVLLAMAGYEVISLERHGVIFTLLEDGLRRLGQSDRTADQQALARIDLQHASAMTYLEQLNEPRPDVVYLDPMFPSRTKSALVKKEMRLCRRVTGDDLDAHALLTLARRVALRRVVVKRPRYAEPLDGTAPDLAKLGRSTRFDIYLPTSLEQ